MKKTAFAATVATAIAAMASPATAAVILSTGFSGVTESTSPTITASGFSWTSTTGEAANASTSLTFTGSATGFLAENAGTGEVGEPIGVAGNIGTSGPWSTSFTFTPTAYTFTLTVSSPNNAGNNIALNSLTLNGTAVPEPSSAALLGLAGLSLLTRRRR